MGMEIDIFNEILRLMPEGWEAKAKELGALKRARGIKSPALLLKLILIYVTEGKSFAGTKALIELSEGIKISKVAVFKRIQKCMRWLKWLCENICRQAGLLNEKPKWLQNKNVLLVDGSEDTKGGKNPNYYMLHYSVELFTLSVREILLSDIKTGEKLSNFNKLGKEDIVMGDRAYTTLNGLEYLMEKGTGYVLRMNAGKFHIYNDEKQKIDILECFSRLKALETADIYANCLINGRYEPVRICAIRKDRESEEAGLKRLSKTNQRKKGNKEVSALQKENNKYTMVITSIGKEASAEQILNLYRARWQIEIAFKRLKSIFHYNEMPARQPENIKTWFYGKLLLAALCETMVNTGRFSPSG